MRLENKVAIITGAGSEKGIGHATAQLFIKEGAKVLIQDINKDGLKKVEEEIKKTSRNVISYCGNICNYGDMEKMVEITKSYFGRIDILVHAAAVTQSRNIFNITNDEWQRIINIDLTGAFFAIKAVIKEMQKNKYGKIVTISSLSGKQGGGIFGGVHYSAAKAGIEGLTKTVARNSAPFGIYANAICPGMIKTDISRGQTSDEEREERRKKAMKDIPLGRLGNPEEVANAILFLASDESSYITGEVIDINGGMHID
ncbi:MAG: SDR family NAD(P)-dependent oxidoreductase [Eubacteriaceae bacterium]